MSEIADWYGRPVAIRYSRGASKVPYVEDWKRNVLGMPDGSEPPAFLMRQVRAYVARPAWFSETDAAALSTCLGRISKFQSLRSEDAMTRSWFGTLNTVAPDRRRASIQWLCNRLELDIEVSDAVEVRQWLRVPHPNATGRVGPEIDAVVDDAGGALIYVEAKWDAPLGTGLGTDEGTLDDQIVLRCRSMDPRRGDSHCRRIVLGISRTPSSVDAYARIAAEHGAGVSWLTWTDLATCDQHPYAREFREYLAWKQRVTLRSSPSTTSG